MINNIWLVNKYAMPPHHESRLRTIKFAHYLQEMGYKVTIFGSSVMHNMDLDLIDDIVYTYGDIISLFLKEYVSSCKLSNSLEFNKFMKERFDDFCDEFIINNGFSPKKYEELYKKRLELVKK